jgi:hypothetical protein
MTHKPLHALTGEDSSGAPVGLDPIDKARLVARYLASRWSETLADLVSRSLEQDELAFEDLDIDLDLRELRRVARDPDLLSFCQICISDYGDRVSAKLLADLIPAERAGPLLAILAINVAAFGLGKPRTPPRPEPAR